MVQGPAHRLHGDLVRGAVLPAKTVHIPRRSPGPHESRAIHGYGEAAVCDHDDWRRDNGHIRNLAAHRQSCAPDEELVSVKTDFLGCHGDISVALLAVDRLPRVPD